MRALKYLRARLGEKSTLAGFIAALTAASIVPSPWCYPVAILGLAGVLYPEDKPDAA